MIRDAEEALEGANAAPLSGHVVFLLYLNDQTYLGEEGRRQAVTDWQWDSIIDGLVQDYYNVTEDTYADTHFNKTVAPNSGVLDRGEEILSNPLWGPAIAAANRAGA